MVALGTYFAQFDKRVRVLAAGQLVNVLGRSMAMPFLTVYFHVVKGFSLTSVAWGLSLFAATGIVFGLVAGAAADRFGRKPVMLVGMLGGALAMANFVFADTYPRFLLACAVNGMFANFYSPGSRAMVADVTPPERRARAYGMLWMAANVGFGAGVGLGGVLASVSFRLVFFTAAAGSFAFFLLILLAVPETRPGVGALAPSALRVDERGTPRDKTGFQGGLRALFDWRAPLADRAFLLFVGVDVLFGLAWSQFGSTLPVYAETTVGLSTLLVGVLLGINGLMIVLLQIPSSEAVDRRRRTRSLLWAAATLAAAFALWALAGVWALPLWPAFALMAVGMVAMTTSEMLRTPIQAAFVADLAERGGGHAHTGRYMGFLDFSMSLGSALGPVAGGALVDAGHPVAVWLALGALMAPAALGLVALRRRVPAEVDEPVLRAAPA